MPNEGDDRSKGQFEPRIEDDTDKSQVPPVKYEPGGGPVRAAVRALLNRVRGNDQSDIPDKAHEPHARYEPLHMQNALYEARSRTDHLYIPHADFNWRARTWDDVHRGAISYAENALTAATAQRAYEPQKPELSDNERVLLLAHYETQYIHREPGRRAGAARLDFLSNPYTRFEPDSADIEAAHAYAQAIAPSEGPVALQRYEIAYLNRKGIKHPSQEREFDSHTKALYDAAYSLARAETDMTEGVATERGFENRGREIFNDSLRTELRKDERDARESASRYEPTAHIADAARIQARLTAEYFRDELPRIYDDYAESARTEGWTGDVDDYIAAKYEADYLRSNGFPVPADQLPQATTEPVTDSPTPTE